mgnify:CR=1 FL=1|jgi:hypothetical protein
MKKLVLIFVPLLAAITAFSQQDSSLITIHKDARLDSLVEKHKELNEIALNSIRKRMPGYRIMVINTNDRSKANQAKTKFYTEFPQIPAYLIFQAPFYKLNVGNFLEREEAEQQLNVIRRVFGNSVYIVRDIVEVRPDNNQNSDF